MSKLMLRLTSAEKCMEIADDNISLMALFNIAEMEGSLPYDMHVRKTCRC